jgi:hypothetical protein
LCAQTAIFSAKPVSPKMRKYAFYVSPKRVRITDYATLCRIFSSNKSAPANRKKGFDTSHLPKNEKITVDGFLYEAARILNSLQNFKIKI